MDNSDTKEFRYSEHFQELVIKGLTIDEQETVIVIPRNGSTRISTSDNTMLTKLKRIMSQPDCDWELVSVLRAMNETDPYAVTEVTVECKDPLITIRGSKIKRELTEEQRVAMSERLKAIRKTGKNESASPELD